MLNELVEGRKNWWVFDAELTPDKKHVRFVELCDGHYSYELTKREVYELADDLKQLADQIVE